MGPLEPGKRYTKMPNGEFIEVNDAIETAPVPEEDLPPDLRGKPVPSEAPAQEKTKPTKPKSKATSKKEVAQPEATPKLSEAEVVSKVEEALNTPKAPQIKLTDADKYAFIKALVSGLPYKKQYPVFGGKLIVTFRTMNTEELDALSEALVIQSLRIPFASTYAMAAAHMRLSMSLAVDEIQYSREEGITVEGFKSPLTEYSDQPCEDTFYVKDKSGATVKRTQRVEATPGQKVLWAANSRFNKIEVPIYNILFNLYQKFDAEVNQLVKETADPDFFTTGDVGLWS
jgi:hypothetical protein